MSGGIPIAKMSGAGNDFVVLSSAAAAAVPGGFRSWVRRVCRRGLSVGADGVLVLERMGPGVVRMDFYNPDGSEAFCGNGSRCAARYAALEGWVKGPMRLRTSIGRSTPR